MAITRNAKKAIRSHGRKRVFNVRRKRTLHDTTGAFRAKLAPKSYQDAEALLPKVYEELDKSVKRGIIKQNTASRTKSRLVKALRTAQK